MSRRGGVAATPLEVSRRPAHAVSFAPMHEGVDDRQLMLRYQGGEASAFDTLYARHKGPLYRYCMRQCHNAETAADLYQEVWARVVKARNGYRPLAKFTTWLYQIAHNAWVDHVRRETRRPTLVAVDDNRSNVIEPAAAPSANPATRALARETAEQIIAALEALPAEQREVFLLKEETDLTLEEIGVVTGVARETVKSRLRYALKKLRTDLQQVLPASDDSDATDEPAGETR